MCVSVHVHDITSQTTHAPGLQIRLDGAAELLHSRNEAGRRLAAPEGSPAHRRGGATAGWKLREDRRGCVKNKHSLQMKGGSEVRGHHEEGGVLSVSQVGSAPTTVSTGAWRVLATQAHLSHSEE